MTNAAVLPSFIAVDAGLVWMSWRGKTAATAGVRARDVALGVLAVLICGWLLRYTGVQSIIVAVAFGAGAYVFGRWWRSRPR
ncbi:MAG: hypothetical protein EXR43_02850 [Dehalococcoidia bacterium]|nr:hypothetical protein [Dehalococcoidia bacterium]